MKKNQIPFWKQTFSFTCDPACLLMAMKALDLRIELSKELELEIWREAYGIGIPGCLPPGLAYSALKRGFTATVICPEQELHRVGKIAEGENAEVTIWTSKNLFAKALALGMKYSDKELTLEDLSKALKQGAIPLVMINMERMHQINSPHWVVVTEVNSKEVIFQDPYVENGRNTKLTNDEFKLLLTDLQEKWEFAPRALLIAEKK